MTGKLLPIISFIIIMSLLPGCWSRREIEDLAIVSAAAFDRVNIQGREKYRFTLQVIRPDQLGGGQQRGGGGGSKSPEWVAASYGDTVYDAGRNFVSRSSRNVVLYHNKVIIIGERTARQGVAELLDFLNRHKDIRLRNWILVSQGEAFAVLQNAPEIEELLSDEISGMMINTVSRVSKSYAVDLREFTAAMVSPGIDAVATGLQIKSIPERAGMDPVLEQGEPNKSVQALSLAVFRRDRLAGWLNEDEGKGYLYITGRSKAGVIPVKVKKEKISFLMTRAKSEIIPRVDKGKISMHVKIKAEGDLGENSSLQLIATPEAIAKLNREVAREIHRLAMAALKKAQREYQADIFGFGQKVHHAAPDFWHRVEDKWYDIYPNIDVKVEVTVEIRRTGMIGDTYKIK